MDERAFFRATRTQVGLTQQDIAAKYGVPIGFVANWENAKKEKFPVPPDALDYVRRLKAFHDDEVARRMEDLLGSSRVVLPYYRSQPEYERAGGTGYYAVENGINLSLAAILEYDGAIVEWNYPPRNAVE